MSLIIMFYSKTLWIQSQDFKDLLTPPPFQGLLCSCFVAVASLPFPARVIISLKCTLFLIQNGVSNLIKYLVPCWIFLISVSRVISAVSHSSSKTIVWYRVIHEKGFGWCHHSVWLHYIHYIPIPLHTKTASRTWIPVNFPV